MDSVNYNDRLYTTICSEKTIQSETKGFFLDFASNVIHFAGLDWLNNTFGKLKNDRVRIQALLVDDQVNELVCETLLKVQCIYRKKDAKMAKAKRESAQAFLKTGLLEKALVMYCQSVLRAPAQGIDLITDAGRTLAIAYWNRSEVLSKLGEVTLALNDLQLALKEGLSDCYKPELYARMAACYQALGEQNKAKVSLALSEKLFGKNNENFKKIKNNLIIKSTEKETRRVLPELTGGPLSFPENASSLLELKETVEMGRYFVAKKPISTGDVLTVELPRAACLLPKNFGSHCHHCFNRLVAPVGCPDCISLAFCSIQCRDKALETYHKFECKILDMLIGSGMSILCHISLRIITQDGLEKSLKTYKDRSSETVMSLCSHEEKRDSKDFLQRTLMAVFLLRCLQKCEFFPDKKGNDDMILSEEELQVGELLSFYLQMLQFNAHEIYETKHAKLHKFRTAKTGYVAVGVFVTTALFNHDCYPGVSRYFVDKNIVIRASRPLKPGEIVAENYGPTFLMKTLADRQRSLSSRYWFKCQCVSCKEDWPLLGKLQNRHARLKCVTEGCDYLFSQPVQVSVNCPRCRKKICLKKSLDILKYCEEQYKTGLTLFDSEKPDEAVPILSEAVDLFHSVANAPHRDTHLAQEGLRSCYAHTGNVYECLIVL